MDRIRLATLNWWSRHGDWPRRREVLRDGFDALAPDLVALQESVVTDDYDQVVDVFGDRYHVVHQKRRHADGTGCSIVSRWPPVNTWELDLCVTARVDPGDFVGCATAIEVETPLGPLLFVNHKPSWRVHLERERELQAVTTARFIEDLAGDRGLHVVVAGDMDARPETSSMRFWTGRQSLDGLSVAYQDAWEFAHPGEGGETFTPDNPLIDAESTWSRIPARRIDYILVRCDERGPTLPIGSCERTFDEPVDGIWASDHFGVVVTVLAPSATPRRVSSSAK
ncbi:endonuclease/exonuclease/phosphatase family protein [Phytoactinopolyspora halotolerans]|uniref:Endonuclease/exonuclease/phosphatase domain-containing protein n=1 Tax=Phytoactinopolyspora halotolerans TaxID=1981512 RepID=A0A6L9S755_9ACTN|nr:endonuclease/exonuclease/phosphatase family protein [Phytoactinopolyspora halotolerans]NEE00388.1 hypothetical protein [Phytoactinopolyspora halotolerans]